jgi:hypothetical protein
MLAVHYLGGRLGHIMVPGHGSGGKMAQSKGKVVGSRNDVAVPKMKGTLLRKVGFYFITNAHARAGAHKSDPSAIYFIKTVEQANIPDIPTLQPNRVSRPYHHHRSSAPFSMNRPTPITISDSAASGSNSDSAPGRVLSNENTDQAQAAAAAAAGLPVAAPPPPQQQQPPAAAAPAPEPPAVPQRTRQPVKPPAKSFLDKEQAGTTRKKWEDLTHRAQTSYYKEDQDNERKEKQRIKKQKQRERQRQQQQQQR